MKTYCAQIVIFVSDDVDRHDLFAYVDDAVRTWGELKLVDEMSDHVQSCHFGMGSDASSERHARFSDSTPGDSATAVEMT